MLNKTTVARKLRSIGLNYTIEVTPQYVVFILAALNQYHFTDKQFIASIRGIVENETSMFSKMPNVAMFLKYKPTVGSHPRIEPTKHLPRPERDKKEDARQIKVLDALEKRLKMIGKGGLK